jgi:hypothetical protein
MSQTYEVRYEPKEDPPTEPTPGSTGRAWRAEGHYDQGSAECGAWLYQPHGDERAFYVDEDDLVFIHDPASERARLKAVEPPTPPPVQRASYRKPTGGIQGGPEGVPVIYGVQYTGAQGEVKKALTRAATVASRSLGVEPSGGATYRVGMPEALFTVLAECGDHEAARLACESFLERHPRPADTAPAFGEYRGYLISPDAATGGWAVTEFNFANVMPNGETFESVENARAAVDLLYEHGLMASADFIEECRSLFTRPATAQA